MIQFWLGGARSGKSAQAEQFALHSGKQVHYIATAESHHSMAERIALHQARRPAGWILHEVPFELSETIQQLNQPDNLILVDCLTLWLTNQLLGNNLHTACEQFLQTLAEVRTDLLLVANEVGTGLIPEDEISQQFVIAAGELHQQIARVAHRVCYCRAGFATPVKGSGYG